MAKTPELPVFPRGSLTIEKRSRREIVRRLFASLAAGAAWPFLTASHPIYKHLASDALLDRADAQLADENWKPLFLNPHQNETLIALAEDIVPGSKNALVNRFIDLLLRVDTAENQQRFAASLGAFDVESQQRLGHFFKAASPAEQNLLLTQASSGATGADSSSALREHFENLKGWITGAYYSSEAGMAELGWTGDRFFEQFPGCQHPEGHS